MTLCSQNHPFRPAWANSCDELSTRLQHNGDDIIRLIEGNADANTVLDMFGTEGARTRWTICGVTGASAERGLIRKPSVVSGTTDWDASRGTNADDCQWIVDTRDNHENTDVHECRLPVLSSPRPTAAPTPSVAPTSSRPTEAPVTPAPTLPPFDATTPAPGAYTLILSEVIEGSSYNKVIEIFNPTNDPVELGRYQIRQIFNGQADAEFFLTLPSVMIQPGATFTVCNPAAHDSFLAVCDMTDRVNHNGNDAIFLIYGREEDYEIIDSFGTEPGGMPGPWTVCGQQAVTANAGLRRKPDVARGNTNWASSAGTTADDCEWVVLRGGNDATYTGVHESDFPRDVTSPPTTAAPAANQASGASGSDADDDMLFITVVIIAAVIILIVIAVGVLTVKKNHAKSVAKSIAARETGAFDNPMYAEQQFELADSGTDTGETSGYMDVGPGN